MPDADRLLHLPLAPDRFDLDCDLPMLIGKGTQAHFLGRMRDLRLYGRNLTPTEILQLAEPEHAPLPDARVS